MASIIDQDPFNEYTGNGSTTVYPYTFHLLSADDLVVSIDLVETTAFTLSGVGVQSGGEVTFTVAPPNLSSILISRRVELARDTDYQYNGELRESTLDRDFNRLWQALQDTRADTGGAIRAPYPIQLNELPGDPADYPGYFLGIDSGGNPTYALAPTGTAADVVTRLASTSSPSDGAGMVGVDYAGTNLRTLMHTVFGRTAAEIAAGVTPSNYAYQPGDVRRYGAVGDDIADDLGAFVSALAATPDGGSLSLEPGKTYRLSGPWVWPNTRYRIKVYFNGAVIRADHTGDGIVMTSLNENYGQHVLYEPFIQGPNASYPVSAAELAGTSTGAAVRLGAGGTNAAAAFGNEFHNPRFQGFRYGVSMQAALWCNFYGGFSRFNLYGIYIDGGQTNGNNWYGHKVRENRERGLFSTGNTSGSLTNATANVFHGGGFETNIPYRGDNPVGYSGGYPTALDVTGKGVAVFLTNTYDCIFDGVYFENHNYSVWLNGSSDNNSFERCRFDGGGGGRTGGVLLDISGTSFNTFSRCTKICTSSTEVNVETFNANQTDNQFLDCEGFNFIAANLVSIPFVRNNRKNQAGGGTPFAGLAVPKHGVVDDVSVGTSPGQISAVNTATATLYAYGFGEITFGSVVAGAAGNTTITAINIGTMRNCFLLLRNYQVTRTVTVTHDGATGPIVLKAGANKTLSTYNSQILFWINSLGHLVEI